LKVQGSIPSDRRSARASGFLAALALALAGAVVAPYTARADQKHVVRPGQSLGVIAKQYRTSVSALAKLNGIDPDGILREGQVLKVPELPASKASPAAPAGKAPAPSAAARGAAPATAASKAASKEPATAEPTASKAASKEPATAGPTAAPPVPPLYVSAGQTLSQIARDHRVSTAALAAANNVHPDATLQIGQKLELPEGALSAAPTPAVAKPAPAPTVDVADTPIVSTKPRDKAKIAAEAKARAVASATTAKSTKFPWGKPKQPGVVELFRIWSRESVRLKLVDARGRARQEARRALREFLRPRDSQRRKYPNARLLALLARVSDHFGGRPLHIVSGYRIAKGLTRKTSRHVAGEAIDFRIPGVPLTVLRDYCQQFPEVGVGYYPTTEFVHLDVRKNPARWTDWSLPGQPPVLSKPVDNDENGAEEVLKAPPSEKTAERTHEEQSRHVDAPTG
jgi:uncharacterized protein YcbK (DUF882 family)